MARRVIRDAEDVPDDGKDASDRRLQVLLADWSERQREIVVRSQSENYIFVLLITVTGVAAATFATIGIHSTAFQKYFALLSALGALVLSSLPINLSHIASSTEVRRLYVQRSLEPKIARMIGADPTGADAADPIPLMGFEAFDRQQHRGALDFAILVRALFSYLPSTLLLIAYAFTRVPAMGGTLPDADHGWQLVGELAIVILTLTVLVTSAITGIVMYRRIVVERRKSTPSS